MLGNLFIECVSKGSTFSIQDTDYLEGAFNPVGSRDVFCEANPILRLFNSGSVQELIFFLDSLSISRISV